MKVEFRLKTQKEIITKNKEGLSVKYQYMFDGLDKGVVRKLTVVSEDEISLDDDCVIVVNFENKQTKIKRKKKKK